MKTIILNSKKYGAHELLVDDDDFERINKYHWYVVLHRKTYYAHGVTPKNEGGDGKKSRRLHRFLLEVKEESMVIDHINHNGLDNRRCNLRVVTNSQNAKNKSSQLGSSSKYLGVSFRKETNKWRSRIRHDGKTLSFGDFLNEIDAAIAYNEGAKLYYGEFANLNIINN